MNSARPASHLGTRHAALLHLLKGLLEETQVRRFARSSLDAHVKFRLSAQSYPMRQGSAKPRVKAAGVNRVKVVGGQIRGALCATALGAIRAGALSIGGSEAETRPRHQERINALPRPPASRNEQRTLPGHGRSDFAERQSPHGRRVRPTIESMTGRRASSIWVGSRLEPGLRMVRTANGPLHMGPFLLREAIMGREINLEGGNRLNLRDAVALSHSHFLMLKAAFEQRLSQVDGVAVMLDSVVEIATEGGYKGTMDQAASILKVEGGFIVEPGPGGRLTVRRPDVPASFTGGNSAHG